MFPYWILFSVFAAGAVQYRADERWATRGGLLFLVMCFFTIIMVGLRSEVGGDWGHYADMFRSIGYRGFAASLDNGDPAYVGLNWLANLAGLDVWAVNLVCAVIFVWGLARFARRQPNPWLVMLVAVPYLIIVVAMGYTRQAVAIGLILAGLAVLEKGVLRFSVYLLMAVAFHKSALVVLPLVALSTPQRKIVTAVIMAASAVLLFYLFVQASYDRMVSNYVDSAYSAQGAGIRVAMNVPPAIVLLLFRKRFVASEQEHKLWRNFAWAALAAMALWLFTTATAALDRIALYLIPLQMFVLARMPYVFRSRFRDNLPLLFAIVAYSASIQFVWLNYAVNSQFWIPYHLYGFSQAIDSY